MKRRIILTDADGNNIHSYNDYHHQLDASDLPNANNMFPLHVAVEEQCNLGDWHQTQKVALSPWGES